VRTTSLHITGYVDGEPATMPAAHVLGTSVCLNGREIFMAMELYFRRCPFDLEVSAQAYRMCVCDVHVLKCMCLFEDISSARLSACMAVCMHVLDEVSPRKH
jgi:hypothetical protein